MTMNYMYWRDDDDSSAALIPDVATLQHVLGGGKSKAMPVVSFDGNVVFLAADKDKDEVLLDKKLGLVLQESVGNSAAALCQSAKHFMVPQHGKLEGHYALGSPYLKNRVYASYSSQAEDDARRQILEAVSRKGVTAVAPTTSVGLLGATSHEQCAPKAEVQLLLDKIKSLEIKLTSSLPYLQMYKFGAGSLLVAVVSLIVWAFTGAGVPFHPVFAALVIPAAIGLMVMAFLVRREFPDPPKMRNK